MSGIANTFKKKLYNFAQKTKKRKQHRWEGKNEELHIARFLGNPARLKPFSFSLSLFSLCV